MLLCKQFELRNHTWIVEICLILFSCMLTR